jgi:SAM-dependent methyltransferase
MRILLLNTYFPPDTGSAAHLFYELGTALVERDHQVTVLTGIPGYHALGSLERYAGKKWIREKVNGMDVVRVATPQLPRHLMIGRALWHFGGAATAFLAGLGLPHHDVAMVYSPPLPLGLVAWGLQRLRGIPFVLNVQDLFPRSIIDLGLLRNRWIIRVFEAMERFVYRRSEAISLPFPTHSFDSCLSVNVFSHVVNYKAALQEIARVLRPGGFLVVNFPNLCSYYLAAGVLVNVRGRALRRDVYTHWHTLWSFRQACAQAGLIVKQVVGQVHLPDSVAKAGLDAALRGLDQLSRNSFLRYFCPTLFVKAVKIDSGR